jgi:hypothetical protein
VFLFASLALNGVLWLSSHGSRVGDALADTGESDELSAYMSTLQHHTHKLGLSIQARNKPLAGFYLDEIGEAIGIIQRKFPTYDKLEIADLADAMPVPSVSPVAKAIAASDWPGATRAYAGLIDSCNDCHAAANHDFIKITVPTGNPFNQSFSTK